MTRTYLYQIRNRSLEENQHYDTWTDKPKTNQHEQYDHPHQS